MMGSQQNEPVLFAVSVNLEKRVRSDHPLRALRRALGDLDWVRQEVAPCYGRNGHVSIDPVVIVKMLVLLFIDDIPSERELMAVIAERLDYLWFLDYGLDDAIPNHSVLSKARARWGREIFEKIFTRTVLTCARAGLVKNNRLLIDSSLIQANASNDSIVQAGPELVAALRQACAAQEAKLDEMPPVTVTPLPTTATPAPTTPTPVSGHVNATRVSTTDPEATLARKGKTPARLSYKSHRAVDDAHGVITAVQTTTGEAGDAAQLPGLLDQHETRVQEKPKTIVGDAHYGSAENYRHCQSQGVAAHLKPVYAPRQKEGRFAPEDFQHDAAHDCLTCPAGKILTRHSFKKSEGVIQYRIERAEDCAACALRAQCTTAGMGRTVELPLQHEIVRAGKELAGSAAAMASYKVRRHCVEGSFADAANNHGFKRARWRGLRRQQIQDWLIAAVQNLRLLMKRGWRGGPAGAGPSFLRALAACFLLQRLLTSVARFFHSPRCVRPHNHALADTAFFANAKSF
jgi:transposase